MGTNNFNLETPQPVSLPAGQTHISRVLETADYATAIADVVVQREAGDTSVVVRGQSSDDGVLWHDPPFSSTLTVTAGSPVARTQATFTPARRFGRLTLQNTGTNKASIDYAILRKTNA